MNPVEAQEAVDRIVDHAIKCPRDIPIYVCHVHSAKVSNEDTTAFHAGVLWGAVDMRRRCKELVDAAFEAGIKTAENEHKFSIARELKLRWQIIEEDMRVALKVEGEE
jgi:hypothetical protein